MLRDISDNFLGPTWHWQCLRKTLKNHIKPRHALQLEQPLIPCVWPPFDLRIIAAGCNAWSPFWLRPNTTCTSAMAGGGGATRPACTGMQGNHPVPSTTGTVTSLQMMRVCRFYINPFSSFTPKGLKQKAVSVPSTVHYTSDHSPLHTLGNLWPKL